MNWKEKAIVEHERVEAEYQAAQMERDRKAKAERAERLTEFIQNILGMDVRTEEDEVEFDGVTFRVFKNEIRKYGSVICASVSACPICQSRLWSFPLSNLKSVGAFLTTQSVQYHDCHHGRGLADDRTY